MATKAEWDKKYRAKLKLDCFNAYGGPVCTTCGAWDIDNLELHHPDGDGNKDRAERLGRGLRSPGGWNFYLALKRAGYPPGYEVKCTPCHDKIHGRLKGSRLKCAPGEDPTRYDDITPF